MEMLSEYKKDFLPIETFNSIKEVIISSNFPWFFKEKLNNNQNKKDLSSYLTHTFYLDNNVNSDKFKILASFLKAIEAKSLLRVVANFYFKTDKVIQHTMHIDYNFPHKGVLLSLNTCDGGTILEDGTKVDSIENTALFFDPSKLHASTSTTNAKGRFNILVNYF